MNAFCRACETAFNEVKGLQMIVVVVPNEKKDRYDAIKKLTCLDYPGKINICYYVKKLKCLDYPGD